MIKIKDVRVGNRAADSKYLNGANVILHSTGTSVIEKSDRTLELDDIEVHYFLFVISVVIYKHAIYNLYNGFCTFHLARQHHLL